MITNRQKNILIFFITKALFLGIGYSLILSKTYNDSWLCTILGSTLGLIFCFFIKKILIKKNKKDLKHILESIPFVGTLIRLLLIFFSLIIINELLFILKEFIKSFLLINTNSYIIMIPIILIIIYMSFKDYKLITYLIECLFPICLFLLLFLFISLIFKVDYTNIKPILSHSNTNMIKSILTYFSLSTSPLIFLLDMDFEKYNFYNSYIINSLIITSIFIFLVGILGPLSNIYRFPEYMMLKDIKMLNFIEKIENILVISWIIDEIILLIISSLFLKRMLSHKHNDYSFIIMISIVCIISLSFFNKNYFIHAYFPCIISIISIIIIILLFLIIKKETN